MSKPIKFYEDNIFRFGYIMIYLMIFIWASKRYGPNIVFYFDQVEGVAKIESIKKAKVNFTYFHEDRKQNINITAKIRSLKDIERLKSKNKWEIIYSKKFPQRASIDKIQAKPGLGAFLVLLIYSLPLILYRYNFKKK